MSNARVWTPLTPQKFVRGDGKNFWRPIIEMRNGEDVERFILVRIYNGGCREYVKDWRSFDFYANYDNPVVYRSKTRAERIAGRATKRRNKAEAMTMKAVPYEA